LDTKCNFAHNGLCATIPKRFKWQLRSSHAIVKLHSLSTPVHPKIASYVLMYMCAILSVTLQVVGIVYTALQCGDVFLPVLHTMLQNRIMQLSCPDAIVYFIAVCCNISGCFNIAILFLALLHTMLQNYVMQLLCLSAIVYNIAVLQYCMLHCLYCASSVEFVYNIGCFTVVSCLFVNCSFAHVTFCD